MALEKEGLFLRFLNETIYRHTLDDKQIRRRLMGPSAMVSPKSNAVKRYGSLRFLRGRIADKRNIFAATSGSETRANHT